jgi:hypothetical protein
MAYQNARFWVYLNGGPVKITLRPYDSLSWGAVRSTDEGWEREGHAWSHLGDRVHDGATWEGQDCDGRLGRYWEGFALLDELHHLPGYPEDDPNMTGVSYPNWQQEQCRQWDQYAEMAGY